MKLPDRILFLDFDGVLNTPVYIHDHGIDGIDPARVDLLDWILDETKAGVVISSTWRLLTKSKHEALGELKDQLARIGMMKNVDAVIDMTPDIRFWNEGWRHLDRGWEIDLWLRVRKFHGDFVVLDDEGVNPHTMHLVKTELYTGLTKPLAEEVVAAFKKQGKARQAP